MAYSPIPAKPGVYELYKHQLSKDTKDYCNRTIRDGKKMSLKRGLKVLEFYQNRRRNIRKLNLMVLTNIFIVCDKLNYICSIYLKY